MLNRSQLITLFGLSRRNKNSLYRLSHDMRQLVVKIGAATFDPLSDISSLLHHIAYGDLVASKALLEMNPRLVLQAGRTGTPSGLRILHTTPLECALGAGDLEMAKMIEPYFNKFDGGETVKDEQYARYRQHIKDMLNPEKNPPYDFTLLLETLMTAQQEDVNAALKRDMTHDSVLRDVLTQFRNDFTPGSIKSGMHFNYQHLLRAFEVYDQNYDDLYKSGNNDFNKLKLFGRQIIGFIQRSLPAIDRMVFAQSLGDVVAGKIAKVNRSFKFMHDAGDFPDTADGYSSLSGLGFKYFVAYVAGGRSTGCGQGAMVYWKTYVEGKTLDLQILCGHSEKRIRLAELTPPHREETTSRCVIL